MDSELIMALYDDLITALPELTEADFAPITGTIMLQDDSDGQGSFIAKWDYSKPLPKGFKVGK
jgi:hypothetical protein